MKMNYVNLYTQTEYSMLHSSISINNLIERAKTLNHKSLAICDEGMHGVIKFYKACIKNHIKPIIGLRVEIKNPSPTTILLFSKNNNGYQNLISIASKKAIGEIDFTDLARFNNGVLCVLAGEENDLIRGIIDKNSRVKELLNQYLEIYRDLYIGINLQSKMMVDAIFEIINFSNENNVKAVAINKTNYLDNDDFDAYSVLRSIDLGVTSYSCVEREYNSKFLSNDEFYNLFGEYKELISNTFSISEKCNVTLEFNKYHFPKYDVEDSNLVLTNICKAGLNKRLKNRHVDANIYRNRLLYELDVISKMGFSDYFLIVYDYVLYAKKSGYLVGPGRGSAAGSLVSYVLGITDVDPIEYDLLFERFLNPERISMPDIDVDFPDDKRDDVIKYIANRHGKLRVAHISTFGTFGPKSVIRDVCRVLKINDKTMNLILKYIPSVNSPSLESIVNDNNELKQMVNNHEQISKLIKVAIKLEGLPRHISTHAAGIIMADDNLTKYAPLQNGINGLYQTQFEATDLESLGLLKMDILGLRNLTIINNVINKINNKIKFSLNDIKYDDKEVFKMISRGDTDGIFQLESSGMRRVLRNLRASTFMDIVHANALYRPGPMEMIDTFISNKFSKVGIDYLHKDLEDILKPTYGIIVFQEQIMLIAGRFAGYSLGMADLLRRAVSKKKSDDLLKERNRFVSSAVKKGYTLELSNKVYDYIVKFANYGFNKSHSVSYSMIAYQMAYLKTYFYVYFMATLMSNSLGSINLLNRYIEECSSKNVVVNPPSINLSTESFEVIDNQIYYSLLGISGIGNIVVSQILDERSKGDFKSLKDFVFRTSSFINKKTYSNLVFSGSLDEFGLTKKYMIENFDSLSQVQDYMNILGVDTLVKQVSDEEYTFEEISNYEKAALGFNLQYDLFIKYNEYKVKNKTVDLINLHEGMSAKILFGVRSIKEIKTKKGDLMAFMEIYDDTSSIESVLFPRVYQEVKNIIEEGKVFIGICKAESRDSKVQVILENVYNLK